MSQLELLPAPAANQATGDELRTQIHRHLMRHPHLTAFEIARALHLPHPDGSSAQRVKRLLAVMEDDGEAIPYVEPRTATDARLVTRWEAS